MKELRSPVIESDDIDTAATSQPHQGPFLNSVFGFSYIHPSDVQGFVTVCMG